MPHRFRWAIGLAALAAICVVLLVGQGSDPSDTPVEVSTSIAPGSAAMRIAIDPETGELSQNVVQAKSEDLDLQEALNRSSEGLVRKPHPMGGTSVHLQGRFQNASVARIDENGNLVTTCVHEHEAVQGFRCSTSHAPSQPEVQ